MTEEQKKFKLVEGPIAKQLVIFALPLLFSNLLQQLYNIVDGFIVGGYVGMDALAGVNQSGKITNLVTSLFLGVSVGAGVIISQFFGAKDKENLSKSIHTTVILSVVFGAVLTVAGLLLADPLLKLMNVKEAHFANASQYLKIYFSGVVLVFIYNMAAGALRAVGDSVSPLIFLGAAVLINTGLDILFVGPLKMGVAGAAWATVISQGISTVLVLIRLFFAKGDYRLRLKKLKPDPAIMKKILTVGLPTGLQNSIISIAHLIMFYFINKYPAQAANGVAAYSRIDALIYIPMSSLTLALSTFVGQNVGAAKYDRVKKAMKISLILGEAMTLVMGVIVFFTCEKLMYFSVKDITPEDVRYAMIFMHVMVLSYPVLVINDNLASTIRGAGQAMIPAVILIAGMCGLRIVFIVSATAIWSNVLIVFLSYPVSWTFTTICLTVYFFKGKWLKKRITGETPSMPIAPVPAPILAEANIASCIPATPETIIPGTALAEAIIAETIESAITEDAKSEAAVAGDPEVKILSVYQEKIPVDEPPGDNSAGASVL